MNQQRYASPDGRRVVIAHWNSTPASPIWYRLYVNRGETATLTEGKGKTTKAVENFCKKHLGEEYTTL